MQPRMHFQPTSEARPLADVLREFERFRSAGSGAGSLFARRFASLDHPSEGRAGWNLVTTSNPDTARNFGREEHMEHDERYRRAREFHDVVKGLWDSWADDAFVRDTESGLFFDPDKLHVLDHKGSYLSVRGPLNIARPVQGWPVVVQARSSEAGRQLAAETTDAVFTAQPDLAAGKPGQSLLCAAVSAGERS